MYMWEIDVRILLIVICCMIAVAIISSIVDNNRIVVRSYNISDSRINGGLRAVFLSDLHNNSFGRDNSRLIDKVKDCKPDVILVGGDMITAHVGSDTGRAVALMKELAAMEIPVIYGIGNHEYRMYRYTEDYKDAYDRYAKALRECGVIILQNESFTLDNANIQIQGLMLDRKYYKRFEPIMLSDEELRKYTGDRNSEQYRVMLAHNPEYFDAYAQEADLVLSGHVHGGIMRLPLLGGVVSTRLTLFPKYDGGFFANGSSKMIVSRGLGSHTIPLRIFNPAELVVINLCKE